MLKKVLRYLSRIFLPYLYTPEGFRLTERPFVVPENLENVGRLPEKGSGYL